jgi:hypothetical protein
MHSARTAGTSATSRQQQALAATRASSKNIQKITENFEKVKSE